MRSFFCVWAGPLRDAPGCSGPVQPVPADHSRSQPATLRTEHPFRAQTSLPTPTLRTEHPFRAQTSLPTPTSRTEYPFRAQTSLPTPTLRTEHPFRAQTSLPVPTLRTEHPFHAQTALPTPTLRTKRHLHAQTSPPHPGRLNPSVGNKSQSAFLQFLQFVCHTYTAQSALKQGYAWTTQQNC